MFVGVRVTVPVDVGVIVNVCAVDELENVNTVGVESPPPEGVIVIVPVYVPFGVTVKLVDAVFTVPDVGPVRVKDVAEALGFGSLIKKTDEYGATVTLPVYLAPVMSIIGLLNVTTLLEEVVLYSRSKSLVLVIETGDL